MQSDRSAKENTEEGGQEDGIKIGKTTTASLMGEMRNSKTSGNNNNERNEENLQKVCDTKPVAKSNDITLADIIGEFGIYQLSLTLITFIRYVCVALMTNAGPLLAPSLQFWCKLPDELDNNNTWNNLITKPANMSRDDFLIDKCVIDFNDGSSFVCNQYIYNTTEHGITLTNSFNLVCQRDWLRSAFQSAVSVGVLIASVVWGSFSDKHGRHLTIQVNIIGAILAGTISYLADNLLLYAISRSFCSFCELGLVVSLITIVVELFGNKYRGAVCIIVYTGWAFGVMIMPWITEHFKNYHHVMLFTIFLNLTTLPWLLTVKESVRWSLVNGKIDEANEELKRISRWNLKGDSASLAKVDEKFDQFKIKYVRRAEKKVALDAMKEVKKKNIFYEIFISMFGGLSKIGLLFKSRELITTLTLVWTTFNCELLYMFTILINNDIGDKKLNYAIGGIMETLATIISIVMISKLTRRSSLVTTLIAISILCLTLSYTHDDLALSTWFLNLTKLAVSTLSSIIMVVTTEIFPTNLRQTGIGVAATIGSSGAVVAPFVRTELADRIGMSKVLIILVILPLTAALIVPFFLRETRGLELPDDIDELDDENYEDKKGDSKGSNDSLGMKKISVVSVV